MTPDPKEKPKLPFSPRPGRYAPPLEAFDPRLMQLLLDADKPNSPPIVLEATDSPSRLSDLYSMAHRLRWLRVRMRDENHPLTKAVYAVAVTFKTPKKGQPFYGRSGTLTLHRQDSSLDSLLSEAWQQLNPVELVAVGPDFSSLPETED